MTTPTIQPLETYRLAQYAVPLPCYICETDNTFDAEFCSHCYAPMALAHQAKNQKVRPQMVSAVGASGVGKTVYLGMLMDMLSRQPERMQLLARGAFSITLQQTTLAALSHCEFPQKTPNEPDRWNWVHCQIRRPSQRGQMELIMPDMAGEAVLEEVDHPHTFRVVSSFFHKCTGAMVLIDAGKIKDSVREHNFFTMKLLSYLAELCNDPERGWAKRPVALIFAKADKCEECLDDPQEYAKTHASDIYQYCRERFRCHKFFSSGVAGTCVMRESITEGSSQVPLRIEPRGIIEPFEWLLDKLAAKKKGDDNSPAALKHAGQDAGVWETNLRTSKQMVYVEQAVFTSAETDRTAGYQVVAKSPGVCPEDARELARWGPSHDSLLELGPDAVSLNFHPLPSGAHAVSRTTPSGWEYSGRGGHRIYTQCLIVPPEILLRFADNPFALLRAAQAGGMLQTHDQVPARLQPLRIAGGAAPVDQTLLARLAANPGPAQVARVIQAAFDSSRLALAGWPSPEQLIAGLFSCLPPQCRSEFSFSTGLKFSSRRPFRIVALSGDRCERSRVAHHNNVTVLGLDAEDSPGSMPVDGWARLIERVLATGRTSFLASQLSKRRFNLAGEDLPALGLQLLEELEASALRSDHRPTDHHAAGGESCLPQNMDGQDPHPPEPFVDPPGPPPAEDPADDGRRADAAHHRFHNSDQTAAVAKLKTSAPSKSLAPTSPEVLEKLENLDDLVYDAISGRAAALDRLEMLWPEILAELGEEMLAQSREQYLRYALSLWEECLDEGGVRSPARAVQALDVLCLLFDGA